MQKSSWVIVSIIVIVIIALGGWYFIANHHKTTNGGYTSTSGTNSSMNMSSNSSSNASNQIATNAVTIQNFAFSPANITVKAGTTVTWTNKDNVAHTVTETDSQSGPKSGDVNPNSSYTFTFTKAGTYHYHCSIHPEMVGTVTVTS